MKKNFKSSGEFAPYESPEVKLLCFASERTLLSVSPYSDESELDDYEEDDWI